MADELGRAILEKQLAALGLDVVCAADAGAASAPKVLGADVIVADRRLPDMGAAAFIAVLRMSGATAPVVMLAATPEAADAPVAGSVGTLVKPVSRPDLVAALKGLERPEADPVAAEPDAAAMSALDADDAAAISAVIEAEMPAETVAGGDQNEAEAMPVFGSRRRAPVAPARPERAVSTGVPAFLHATPAAATAAVAMDAGVSGGAGGPVAVPKARAMRILSAEDNKTNQLVFSKLVKTCDIALRFADDGAAAVAAYEAEVPDLVFMDISMPGMDGKEATRRIRAIEAAKGLKRTRIVALTAHAMEGDAEEILSHGLDAHLTKPLKKAAIFAEIEGARPDDARAPLPEEE
ncbi:MAG: response regulator [Maritimibacter sp.]|nr:response regulator [Maritimibacter sp.]